jgi:hypothetical protein
MLAISILLVFLFGLLGIGALFLTIDSYVNYKPKMALVYLVTIPLFIFLFYSCYTWSKRIEHREEVRKMDAYAEKCEGLAVKSMRKDVFCIPTSLERK